MLVGAGLSIAPAHAEADRSIALIWDASGSMKAALPDGQTRMDAAKAAVANFVGTLKPETGEKVDEPYGPSRAPHSSPAIST